jgi:N-acetylglutamate synthase-like GNAT family acetyltransferase
MKSISLVNHAKGAPGLRLFGLGPSFIPSNGIKGLQKLFNENTKWAKNRNRSHIKEMLANSNVIITLWENNNLIGFGRATTDKVYRAVLWDIVISKNVQRIGFGKIILEALINDKQIKSVEKIYLMTTNSQEFYRQLGFKINNEQSLMQISKDKVS